MILSSRPRSRFTSRGKMREKIRTPGKHQDRHTRDDRPRVCVMPLFVYHTSTLGSLWVLELGSAFSRGPLTYSYLIVEVGHFMLTTKTRDVDGASNAANIIMHTLSYTSPSTSTIYPGIQPPNIDYPTPSNTFSTLGHGTSSPYIAKLPGLGTPMVTPKPSHSHWLARPPR